MRYLTCHLLVVLLAIFHESLQEVSSTKDEKYIKPKNQRQEKKLQLTPKYISKPFEENNNEFDSSKQDEEYDEAEDSPPFAMFLGTCKKNEAFIFPLSSGSGYGIIGYSISENIDSVTISEDGVGVVNIDTSNNVEVSHLFPDYNNHPNNNINEENMFGLRFEYSNIGTEGAMMQAYCYQDDTNIFTLYRDNNEENVIVPMKSSTTEISPPMSQYYTNLPYDTKSKVETMTFHDAKTGGIKYNTQIIDDNDIAVTSSTGYLIATPFSSLQSPPIYVDSISINDEDDVIITFYGIDNINNNDSSSEDDNGYKLKARIGIQTIKELNDIEIIPIVDVEAIVNDATLIIHGGWVKRSLEELNLLNDENWEIVVMEAIVTDPNQRNAELGRLISSGLNNEKYDNIFLSAYSKNNIVKNAMSALSETPPSDEERRISNDMLYGRKPTSSTNTPERKLGGKNENQRHKKILIHGYCSSSSPFNIEDFTDAIAFEDPAGYYQDEKPNWSHDEFAKKIQKFAIQNNIKGCSCIAHSQGGAACLHLKTYYWSCLDEASIGSGKRVMQSVGTPYKGTNIAGILALIGNVFNKGCGKNYDLTYEGAKTWLKSIPTEIQNQMYYYTSSYKNKLYALDYCNAFTALLLASPNDGVTEVKNGQLPGGVNLGNIEGYCHTENMRDPNQCLYSEQNKELDQNAMY